MVEIFDEDNPIEFIKKIEPTVHVKSKSGYKNIEGDTVEELGGILVLIPDKKDTISTTDVINKIKNE